jgi:hypothetical protein
MADEELHYPPGAEPQAPAPEPQPEPAPATPEPAPEAPPEPKPEEKPDEKPSETPETPESPLPKKRSVYDDLKDTRQEKNAFKAVAIAALEAQGVTLTGKETAEELQALAKKTPSPAPAKEPAPSAPTDELEAYAQENGLDAKSLSRLAEIIAKQVPPGQLSEADRQELSDLKAWKADNEAKEARAAEDREVLATAPSVKTQLDIHDDAELKAVMDEIVKLSHTEAFHDKEVEYIVWKNKDALSKLVSPKKPSFESGGQQGEAAPASEPDFSSGKGITPAMAQTASQEKRGSALEIRRGK